MADGSTGMVDMEVTPDPDMMVVDPPVKSCDDIIWDCSRNGYCDPLDRPDCALSPGVLHVIRSQTSLKQIPLLMHVVVLERVNVWAVTSANPKS